MSSAAAEVDNNTDDRGVAAVEAAPVAQEEPVVVAAAAVEVKEEDTTATDAIETPAAAEDDPSAAAAAAAATTTPAKSSSSIDKVPLDADAVDVEGGMALDGVLSRQEEAALLAKLDWRLLPLLGLLYLISFLDRVNIGNAKIVKYHSPANSTYADMERDLGMTWNGAFNWTLSIFFVGYVLFEVPSNLLLKRVTPRVWISRIMFTWGVCAMCLAFVSDYNGLMATRFFLGVAEAGFFPGILFYLSFWYRKREYTIRVAMFFAGATMAGAFSGVLGYFLQQVNEGYISGWRALFFWEGIPAIIMSVITYFILPNFPHDAKFLTEAERAAVVNRLKLDGIDTSDHSFSLAEFKKTVTDIRVWLFMFAYIGILTPTYGFNYFLPSIITTLGSWTLLQSQLLSAPPYVFACIIIVFMCFNSDRTGDRSIHILCASAVGFISFMVLAFLRGPGTVGWQYLFTGLAIVGAQGCIPILVSWLSNNYQSSQTSAATATAMVVAFGNIGGIIGPQIYRNEWKASQYQNGHIIMASITVFTMLCVLGLRYVLAQDAKRPGHAVAGSRKEMILAEDAAAAAGVEKGNETIYVRL